MIHQAESMLNDESGDQEFEAGSLLLAARRGAPKNKRLMKVLAETGIPRHTPAAAPLAKHHRYSRHHVDPASGGERGGVGRCVNKSPYAVFFKGWLWQFKNRGDKAAPINNHQRRSLEGIASYPDYIQSYLCANFIEYIYYQ